MYAAEVFDYMGTSKGKTSGVALSLRVTVGPEEDGDGLPADDEYKVDQITWSSSTDGAGVNPILPGASANPNSYCTVGAIDGDHDTKDEDCWLPLEDGGGRRRGIGFRVWGESLLHAALRLCSLVLFHFLVWGLRCSFSCQE